VVNFGYAADIRKLFVMQSITIMQYMKKHGQKLYREITKYTGIVLPQVRLAITNLQSTKAVFNFEGGVAVEGISCRLII
jgi:hypothetical protein